MHFSSPLPATPLARPIDLWQEFPCTKEMALWIHRKRQELRECLEGKRRQRILIVGPCSIHHTGAALEYSQLLKGLAEEVSDSFVLVMRTYFEKPRTNVGWKGLLYDPNLNGSDDVDNGLRTARELLVTLANCGIPTATEFLSATTPQYLGDLISWGCIGARTVSSQPHRQLASGLSMPVGMKNGTNGDIALAIDAIITAKEAHSFIAIDDHGQASVARSDGNDSAHLVLRGGEGQPNFDAASIAYATRRLRDVGLPAQVLVDCSHDNCGKNHCQQIPVFQDVTSQVIAGNTAIRGMCLESNLSAGNQRLGQCLQSVAPDCSITDPCLDWRTTEQLVRHAHERIQGQKRLYFVENPLAAEASLATEALASSGC